jgi:hypothetical protein
MQHATHECDVLMEWSVFLCSETCPAQLDKMSLFIDGESILCVSSKGTYAVDRRIGSLSYMPINISPGKQGRDIDVILGVVRFHTEQFRELFL